MPPPFIMKLTIPDFLLQIRLTPLILPQEHLPALLTNRMTLAGSHLFRCHPPVGERRAGKRPHMHPPLHTCNILMRFIRLRLHTPHNILPTRSRSKNHTTITAWRPITETFHLAALRTTSSSITPWECITLPSA